MLVIKGHQKEWLKPLNDKLTAVLRPLVKIWKLSPTAVTVLNDDLARRRGLIALRERRPTPQARECGAVAQAADGGARVRAVLGMRKRIEWTLLGDR